MYILAAQRRLDVVEAFRTYHEYIQSNESRFPAGARTLVKSAWYFNPRDHKCTHDAWLEEFTLAETAQDQEPEKRSANATIRLLAPYHDGLIQFHYPRVYRCEFRGAAVADGHCDWRYDEFRLTANGRIIHEIEWCSITDTARWIIEAEDVEYRWIDRQAI